MSSPTESLRALAALALCILPASACSQAAAKFNLACHGQIKGEGSASVQLQVDLTKKQFCDQDGCQTLTQADAAILEFDCKAHDGGRFCSNRGTQSSAGPNVWGDHLVFDRKSGRLTRHTWGTAGDPASHPFTEDYAGDCVTAPFAPVPPRPIGG